MQAVRPAGSSGAVGAFRDCQSDHPCDVALRGSIVWGLAELLSISLQAVQPLSVASRHQVWFRRSRCAGRPTG
jgi:hypothetical protein